MDYPQRKSPRLKGYDYRSSGSYFVTICTVHRLWLFGDVIEGRMNLSPLGQVAETRILAIPEHHRDTDIYCHVVMPNHVHMMIGLHGNYSLSTVVGSYKASVTRQARLTGVIDEDQPIWQARYHDHIVRSSDDFDRIAAYIASNPDRWSEDSLFSK
ncbi:transposase [Aggregatilineales bacterium SYSU G02658]